MMDEVFSLDILYVDEYVPEQLYELVRQGLCSQLDAQLHELSNCTDYLTALTWHGRERLSLLMVAAFNGYDDIVRVLLTHCDSAHQIELKGQVVLYDEKLVKDATALYCACYRGHFNVAKTLIELGQANVKQGTYDYPDHPLFIHATIMNRQDIVHFLLENKYADVNETKSNDYESTALILATFKGYTSLVKYLIENGADVNYSSRNRTFRGSTAVMSATIRDHVDALRLLYNAGANINIRDDTGDTLLMIAAKNRRYSIVSFLLEQSINNTVDDLELAACYLSDITSPIEQMNVVFDLLRVALQQRQLLQIPKVCIQSMDIYDYQQECQTIDELDRIKTNRDRIFIETLLIRERIYSSQKNGKIMKPLASYGDRFAYKNEFDKCLNVYIRSFYIQQEIDTHNNLARFVWLFCKMLTNNQMIPIHRFVQVCCLTFELTQSKYDMDLTTFNALFLVIIAIKILEQKGITKEEQTLIYSWIRDLCRHQLTTGDGQTLLHHCVNEITNSSLNFRSVDTKIHIKFPNESGLRLLLACGSPWLDLDAIESSGNTPLHIICKIGRDQKIIKLLLNFGSHMDCVNKDGKIPLDYLDDEKIKALFTTKPPPDRLKCLCARIMVNQRFNIDTSSALTSTLKKFIFLHSSLRTQSDLTKRKI